MESKVILDHKKHAYVNIFPVRICTVEINSKLSKQNMFRPPTELVYSENCQFQEHINSNKNMNLKVISYNNKSAYTAQDPWSTVQLPLLSRLY